MQQQLVVTATRHSTVQGTLPWPLGREAGSHSLYTVTLSHSTWTNSTHRYVLIRKYSESAPPSWVHSRYVCIRLHRLNWMWPKTQKRSRGSLSVHARIHSCIFSFVVLREKGLWTWEGTLAENCNPREKEREREKPSSRCYRHHAQRTSRRPSLVAILSLSLHFYSLGVGFLARERKKLTKLT